ncbi:lysis protein [Jinshanibacter sp. LJY008]|uniref:Lysis protein n=1 Tax=Limnobaculum eriocheiris TaxID=2897391 RepID=A0A9X1MUM6_9GAMM|nr:lysis system i-spanin subunit Rz [Limnobaculum eriocheiris]MCD1124828.1 lysis protein [Limnobaculum eriocheiris]
MKWISTTAILAVITALLTWTVSSLIEKNRTLNANLKASERKVATLRTLNDMAAEMDTRHTGKLKDEKGKNNQLRTDINAGVKRVYITAKCPNSPTARTGSVGDDTLVELSRTSGSAIPDIRDGIISDRAKIDYLQDYIKKMRPFCKIPQ